MFSFLGQAIVGWLIADLIGGFVHWWEDRVARPRWAWLDKHFWEPNRLHHDQPMAFTRYGFWYRNSTTFLFAGAVCGVWFFAVGPSIVLLFAALGGMFQNEIHYWAHKKKGGWIAVFQKVGVFQSVPEHARHHKPPQDKNYCILTDWLNPLLEHAKFWVRLERFLGFGTRPEAISST